MRRSRIAALLVSLAFGAVGCRQDSTSGHGGITRTYFLAADEVDWTYAPDRAEVALTGKPFDLSGAPDAVGMLDPNQTTYRKAVFREYTDSTFTTLKPRDARWEHLGVLGPVLRAVVGDTIVVVFRNHATRPYSLHPHGVFYAKNAEGFAYQDGSDSATRGDDSIPPGGTYRYVWPVPERAGPAEGDGSSTFWLYHSHVDEGRDINTGLIGAIIVTRQGMARPDGSPTDVDREFVVDFGMFDEPMSWYWPANVVRLYGDSARYLGGSLEVRNTLIHDFHHFYTINGFFAGNGPMMRMRQGERVRWYVFTNPNEEHAWDIHTVHWHGQTVVAHGERMDMVPLTPMMTVVADMIPDNPGTWLLHCHMPGHFNAGMYTRFMVSP